MAVLCMREGLLRIVGRKVPHRLNKSKEYISIGMRLFGETKSKPMRPYT